jgi:hypothetical protein
MPRRVILALCALAGACVSTSQAPPNLELTWVKPHVAFEGFVADVDACNASAEVAGRAVAPRRGDPANDLAPPILFWRWLEHGADVDAAMAQVYEGCFRPRGYTLAYVSEADAQAFRDIGAAPIDAGEPVGERWALKRDAQLHLLHRLATAPRPVRARIATNRQRRPLLAQVAPP